MGPIKQIAEGFNESIYKFPYPSLCLLPLPFPVHIYFLRVIVLVVGSNKLSLYLCFKAEQTQFFQFLYIHHDLQSPNQLGGSPQGSIQYISILLVLKLLLGSSTLDTSKMWSPNTKHRRTTSFNLLAPLLLITGFG